MLEITDNEGKDLVSSEGRKIVTSFSYPVWFDEYIEDLVDLVKKDHPNYSKRKKGVLSLGIRIAIKEYVDRHKPGNPQLTLPSSMGLEKIPKSVKEELPQTTVNLLRNRGLPEIKDLHEDLGDLISKLEEGGEERKDEKKESRSILEDRPDLKKEKERFIQRKKEEALDKIEKAKELEDKEKAKDILMSIHLNLEEVKKKKREALREI